MKTWLGVLFVVLLPTVAWSHPGRTNAQGCHNDRKHGGYHCHGGTSDSSNLPTQPQLRETPDPVSPAVVPSSGPAPTVRSSRSNEPQISIPSDSKAKFFVLKTGGTKRKPTLTTRRESSSGTTYATREFDCDEKTVRYLGTGDTPAAMGLSIPEDKMTEVIEESIAWYLWKYACKK